MSDKRFEITIIVNGQPVEVKVGLDEQIGEAVDDALKDSGNSGQPAERWELRDESGSTHRYWPEDWRSGHYGRCQTIPEPEGRSWW